MTEDHRVDQQSRDRITELQRYYSKVALKLTLGMIAVTVMMVLALIASGIAIRDTRELVEQQQASRLEASRRACELRNTQDRGIIAYLRALGAKQADIEQAQGFFPVEPDCEAYAVKQTTTVTPTATP